MEIRKTTILVRDLVEGYQNETETDIELGVFAYGGKLCVRPAFQRSFVYDKKQENAVIDTVMKGFPLNIMYWVDNGDGTYDCLDGQQRTISICNFADGTSSFKAPWCGNGDETYIHTLKRINKDLVDKFYNYPLEVYICKGSKTEQLEWFRTINIAGERLYPQELRNANYSSAWLTDAKKYFSRADARRGTTCPAERIGGQYTNKDANRQEILEQVIGWRVNSTDDNAICNYMAEHALDKDASNLWNYFNDVISWVKSIFPGTYDKGMKSVNWGKLYNEWKDTPLNIDEINNIFNEYLEYRAAGELTVSVAKICEFCITRDENLLKHREFSETEKTVLYNKQNGCCGDCGKHFSKNEMQAHHIISWHNGGTTELSNGVMLCKECHIQRHL